MNALILGLIAAFCWGLHDIAIRYLSRTVPLLGALFIVLTTGMVFQGALLLATQTSPILTGPAFWYSLAAGVCFLTASIGLYYAFERGPVRLVSPIIGAYPVLSLTFAALGGTPVTFHQVAAVLMIVLAVGVVAIFSDHSDEHIPARGPTIILSLISAIGFAATFKLGQMAALTGGEWESTFATRVTALALLAVILWRLRPKFRIGRSAVLPLIIMGLLDGIALLAVISAADMARPEFAAVASSMFGLFTILLARLLLKEHMAPIQWAGCLLAFAGIGYLAL